MIIYGIKPIHLKTIDIPIRCSSCSHSCQRIHIYRNFLSLFFIPFVPLRKKAIVGCLNCGRQRNKRSFFKEKASEGIDVTEAKIHFKKLVKEAKTPLYAFAMLCIVTVFFTGSIAWVHYNEHHSAIQDSSYFGPSAGNGQERNRVKKKRDFT